LSEHSVNGRWCAPGHAARAGARRRTQAALEIWQEMADKASTPSTVLLPPAKRPRTGELGAAEAAPGAAEPAAHGQPSAADERGRAPGGVGPGFQGEDQAPGDAPPRAALAAEARGAAAAAVEGEAAQA
jgi:hypothetical protein